MLLRKSCPLAAALAAAAFAACGQGGGHGDFKPPPPVVEVVTVAPETVGTSFSSALVASRGRGGPEIDSTGRSTSRKGQVVKRATCCSRSHAGVCAPARAETREARRRSSRASTTGAEISAQADHDKASAGSMARAAGCAASSSRRRACAPFDGSSARAGLAGERVRRGTRLNASTPSTG
jgi:hypothetical protein